MENSRTRIPGEWAPPPPIVVAPQPQPVATPPPLRPEEEFEATLGSLVEHFTTLPPPSFGEAPELAATPAHEPRPSRRSPALIWVSSLVLGATVAGGVVLGLKLARNSGDPAPAPTVSAPKAVPAPTIVVKSLPDEPAPVPSAAPTAEPIADEAAAVENKAAEAPKAVENKAGEATKAAPPAAKPRKATIRKRARTRPASPGGPQLPASSGGDGWEDPYK